MKRIILTALILTMLTSSKVMARNTGQTAVIGGATGAVLGQAIGRNTEATLIGTALGSVIGYIIGNEMDKGRVSVRPQITEIVRPVPAPERDYRYYYQEYEPFYESEPVCRETEIIATIDGRPEIINAVACLENGSWIINNTYGKHDRQKVVINNFHCYPQRKKNKHHRHHRKHHIPHHF